MHRATPFARRWPPTFEAVDRFRADLAAAQPSGAGLSLSLANQKNDRERLQRFLDVIGLKLTEKNHDLLRRPDRQRRSGGATAAHWQFWESISTQLVTRLNSGASVRIDVPTETVPLPLPAQIWSAAVFQRPISSESLFSAVIQDRSAALLCYGLAAVDDETLHYLAEQPAVLRRLSRTGRRGVCGIRGQPPHPAQRGSRAGWSVGHVAVGSRVGRAGCQSRPFRSRVVLAPRRSGGLSLRLGHTARCQPSRVCPGPVDRRSRAPAQSVQVFPRRHPGFPRLGVPERPFSRPPDDADPDAHAHQRR